MGQVYRYLYPQVYGWENLLLAWRKARKVKRGYPPAATFEMNAAEHLLMIQHEPQTRTYTPGAYVNFTIHEPKRRLISVAPFRDRVVHYALCNVMEPLFKRRLVSKPSRKGCVNPRIKERAVTPSGKVQRTYLRRLPFTDSPAICRFNQALAGFV